MNTDIILRLLIWAQGEERSGSMSLGLALREAAKEIEELYLDNTRLQNKCDMLESDVEALMTKRGVRAAFLEKELERQVDEANAEIKRLRQENATLTAEHDALRAERDEVRQSYCSLMEAYRGGNGRITANKLGWGYLFEEEKPCQ